jgi:hypothetical protein
MTSTGVERRERVRGESRLFEKLLERERVREKG